MITFLFSDVDRFSHNVLKRIRQNMVFIRDLSNIEVLKYREIPVIVIRDRDLPFIEEYELNKALRYLGAENSKIIFVSRHEMMKNPKPMLTVHTSGNWSKAEYGGKDNVVSICNACLNSNIIRSIRKLAEERELDKEYEIIMEATHHGPSIDYESCFVEVGSSEKEWNDPRCIELFVDLIEDLIYRTEHYIKQRGRISVSIGDLHYCTIMSHVFNNEIDLGHTIPKYINIIEKNVKDAIDRTVPKTERVIIHWKSLKREQRDLILKVLENYPGIEIVKRK